VQERVPQPFLGVVVPGARADRAAVDLHDLLPPPKARELEGEHTAQAGRLSSGKRAGQRALAGGDAVLAREVEALPHDAGRRSRRRGGARGRGQQERRREQRAQNASLFTT